MAIPGTTLGTADRSTVAPVANSSMIAKFRKPYPQRTDRKENEMVFQRRHYEAVAQLLHTHVTPGRATLVIELADAFADFFEKDNKLFHREKFMHMVTHGKKGV